MFDEIKWSRQVRGEDCPLCRENTAADGDEPRLVARLPSGRVLLQNDAAFQGYCILVYARHATELFDLEDNERRRLIDDVNRVARAIREVCKPAKLNYAILGNEVPHLHVHVIPRYPDDGWWGRAIWLRPLEDKKTIDPVEFARLRKLIAERLTITEMIQNDG